MVSRLKTGRQLVRNLRKTWRRGLIPPEIIGDEFHEAIASAAADPRVQTILEIGASSGEGSTAALIEGARRNPSRPTIHAIEASPARYRALIERHGDLEFFRGYNLSSISPGRFPSEERVRAFYEGTPSALNSEPLSVVLDWLRGDIRTLTTNGLTGDGIRQIKEQQGLETFDLVLIDGSEFTGSEELEDVYGAALVLLDDISTFKNFDGFARLDADESYRLVEVSRELRNGYAVFERVLAY
jgi:hypothetical protein